MRQDRLARLLSLLSLAVLSACNAMPREGPSADEIVAQQTEAAYVLIDVDEQVSRLLGDHAAPGFGVSFTRDAALPPRSTVGSGDVLAVRILEAGADGLFAGETEGAGVFPNVAVDTRGQISLPYVGTITVAGSTPAQIERQIAEALAGRAVEPQASVSVVNSVNNTVVVSGDAVNPGVYPLSLRGADLAQMIARAGGSRHPDFETEVTVIRRDTRGSARLDRILMKPSQNVAIAPDDMIVLSHAPSRYTITGAVRQSGLVEFDRKNVSVLEAVSRAGGLADVRADPTGVFVFRYEDRRLLDRLGRAPLSGDASVPTIYRIDFRDVSVRFYAQTFLLRDSDALYVSNTASVQLGKLLDLVRTGLTVSDNANRIGN